MKKIILLFMSFMYMTSLYAQDLVLHEETDGFRWYQFEKNGLVGVKDYTTKKTIIKARYTMLSYLRGYIMAYSNKGVTCFSKYGNKRISEEYGYSGIMPATDLDVFYVLKNHKWGAYWFGEIIAPMYDDICYREKPGYACKGHFGVRLGDSLGIIDAYGHIIIDPKEGYEDIRINDEKGGLYDKYTIFEVKKNGLWGVLLKHGLSSFIDTEYRSIFYNRPLNEIIATKPSGEKESFAFYDEVILPKKEAEYQAARRKKESENTVIAQNNTTQQQNITSDSHNHNHSNQNNTTNSINNNGDFFKVEICRVCGGTGKCTMCGGLGAIWGGIGMTPCPICFGGGMCKMCTGTGQIVMSGNYNTGVANVNGQMMIIGNDNNSQTTNNNSVDEVINNYNKNKKTGTWETKQCSACKGTGKSPSKKSAPYMGGTRQIKYCPICKKNDYSHYHEDCRVCKGTGQVQDYVY